MRDRALYIRTLRVIAFGAGGAEMLPPTNARRLDDVGELWWPVYVHVRVSSFLPAPVPCFVLLLFFSPGGTFLGILFIP